MNSEHLHAVHDAPICHAYSATLITDVCVIDISGSRGLWSLNYGCPLVYEADLRPTYHIIRLGEASVSAMLQLLEQIFNYILHQIL